MFQGVLFELEGVLADTRQLRHRALQDALAHDGISLPDGDCDERCAYLAPRDAVTNALAVAGTELDATAVDLATLRAERRFADELVHGFAMAEGARELVAHLAGRVRLGVVTRANRREADTILTLASMEFAFECVVTSDDVPDLKPSTAPYDHALRVMGRRRRIAPAMILALEDGPPGIRAARRAGLRCLAVGDLPAHRAMLAEGLLPTLRGHTLASIEGIVLRPEERIA